MRTRIFLNDLAKVTGGKPAPALKGKEYSPKLLAAFTRLKGLTSFIQSLETLT